MSSVCARCPKTLGRSCCEVLPHERLATLTASDAARIGQATGRRTDTFVDREWLSHEDARAYEEGRPLYRGYFRRENVRWTLARADGACVFLDRAHGCTLSTEVRPVPCRLYPFEPWAEGQSALLVDVHGSVEAAQRADVGCLAAEEAPDLEALQRAMGLTAGNIQTLAQQLRREVEAHGKR